MTVFEGFGEFASFKEFWTWFVGDGGAASALSLLLIVLGLFIGGLRYFRREKHDHYTELDSFYIQILLSRVDKPWLWDKDLALSGGDQRLAGRMYEQHAYMVWTLLETIYDRIESSKRLQLTWQPIIRTEGAQYLPELQKFYDDGSFQCGFISFVRQGGFKRYGEGKAEAKDNEEFRKKAEQFLKLKT